MGTILAVIAVACSTATPPNTPQPPAPRVREASAVTAIRDARAAARSTEALVRAEKDFARRQRDLGLVGTSPLFGAEGLPKPRVR
jgi:hypothetical protein